MRRILPLLILAITACVPLHGPGSTVPPAASVNHTAPGGVLPLNTLVATILLRDEALFAQRIQLTSFACTHAEGLGGPPKCAESQAEGTTVDRIPVLESHAAYATSLPLDMGPLLAIYRVPVDAPVPEPVWQRGAYGLLFLSIHPQQAITLYADAQGNIVRATIHYLTEADPLEFVPEGSELLYPAKP